jgi:hypothetical protein
MSRQTSSHYYHVHQQLRRFWLTHDGLYAALSPTEQWLLHDYYQPSKDFTKDQLLTHRAEITKRRPGLPQQAGRAYAKFQERAAIWAVQVIRAKHAAKVPTARAKERERTITVRAVVRPTPDYAKLSRALLRIAGDQQAKDVD